MFQAEPECTWQMESTRGSSPGSSRVVMFCSAVYTCAAAAMGSWPSAGCEPWLPSPLMRMTRRLPEAIMQPGFMTMAPAGNCGSGQTCMPMQAVTLGFSIKPPWMIIFAPVMTSSPDWKKSLTEPLSSSFICESTLAAPSSMAQWLSCPQACIWPGWVDL